jgi:tryptophanyl-tRNA synthetase
MNSAPRLLSGIKPTGELHIGNYFGAMRQLVELFQKGIYDCYIFVADYHALNTMQDPAQMQQRSLELAAAYIAVGLDPEKLTLFKQSSVSAHTELAWIFDTITTMPYLMRAHAFKDAEAKNKEISVGTFNYPMLMAADILLYDAAVVPVGADQKQHIEYARDAAEKFNRTYSETFMLPEPYILDDVATVPGIDGRKMSKSYGNVIPLFADRETLAERVMAIVTDSGAGRPENVYAIHRLLKSEDELSALYAEHEGKYKALKEALIEDLDAFIAPLRSRYQELMADPEMVYEALARGGEAASAVANEKMERVRRAVGVA